MSEYGKRVEPRTIRFERLLPGPIDRVWGFLTEPGKRETWLAGGLVEHREGGTIEMIFRNSRLSAASEDVPERFKEFEGMRFSGEVTRYEPPHAFAHTWDGTEVTFELTETYDERVKLVLTQTGITDSEERLGILAGWHTHLDILRSRLEDAEPDSFWTLHERYEAAYCEREAGVS
ncbi:SRPBCC family protein [Marinicauda algicola]|uniref:SRPBCC family protein n=1 Tax=Marinicauda algicola TaxID=2029849 RepID=A0A4S2GWF8_9PROT|nr:SRPBCC family protein [Marinicauda algicola]TGY87427.1 SRPBCC family protein [Marinicauda algicola]